MYIISLIMNLITHILLTINNQNSNNSLTYYNNYLLAYGVVYGHET